MVAADLPMWIEGAAYIDLTDLSVKPADLELSDPDYHSRHGETKIETLGRCPLFFYVRKTTRKNGLERGMFVNSRKGVAEARHYENLWGPVPWTVTKNPERLLLLEPSDRIVDKPVLDENDRQLHFASESGTHAINVRWRTTGEYIVPEGNFYDNTCRFVTTAPAFKNQNMKFMGKSKIKTGAGFIVRYEAPTYTPRNYDNMRFKDLDERQGRPQDFYVPIQYTNPKAMPAVSKATGITLNYPIKGFLITLGHEKTVDTTYAPPVTYNPYIEELGNYYPELSK